MKNASLILILLSVAILSHSQNAHINVPKFKLSASFEESHLLDSFYPDIYGVSIGLEYNLTGNLHVGVYTGYARYFEDYWTVNGFVHFLKYGFSVRYTLTPLLIKKEKPRLDLYLKGISGLVKTYSESEHTLMTRSFDWGTYMGVAYYPWSRIGIYGEAGFGAYTNLRIGMSFNL